MKHITTAGIAASLLFTAQVAHGADTGSAITLKKSIEVTGNYVELGELFDGLTSNQDTVITEAPEPGGRIYLSSYELDQIARSTNIDWKRPSLLKRVTVKRNGYGLEKSFFEGLILDAVLDQGVSDDSLVKIYGSIKTVFLPSERDINQVEIKSFDLNPTSNKFVAEIFIPGRSKNNGIVTLNGKVEERISVPVLARQISPGEIISADDIQYVAFTSRRVNHNAIQNANDLIGMTVRRPLHTNKLINRNDIIKNQVVRKNNYVTMTYRIGNLELSASGRALESGGIGDIVRVMNTKSNLTVEGRITAPDEISVTGARPLLASR